MDLIFFHLIIMLAIAFLAAGASIILYGVVCLYMAYKSQYAHQIPIKMLKVKSLQVIESRFVTDTGNDNFTISAGAIPTQIELEADSATWSESAKSNRGGIYAFQNTLTFRVPSKSLTRRALRSRISAIITTEDDNTFFVRNLIVGATLMQRIGLVKVRTYSYRADSISRAPQVETATSSTSAGTVQIVIRPRSVYYNAPQGIIGVSLLGR